MSDEWRSFKAPPPLPVDPTEQIAIFVLLEKIDKLETTLRAIKSRAEDSLDTANKEAKSALLQIIWRVDAALSD